MIEEDILIVGSVIKSTLDKKIKSLAIPDDVSFEIKELQDEIKSLKELFVKDTEIAVHNINDRIKSIPTYDDEEIREQIKSIPTYDDEEIREQIKSIPTYDDEEIREQIKSIPTYDDTQIKKEISTVTEMLEEQIKSVESLNAHDVEKILNTSIKSLDLKNGSDGLGIDSEIWNKEGVYRKDSVVTHNIGQHFRAIEDTAKEPGVSKTWERVGFGGFRRTGGFKKDFNYANGDLYTKDFSTFLYQNGREFLFSSRGQKGEPGKNYDATKDIKAMQDRHDEAMELQKLEHKAEITKLWEAMNNVMREVKL